MYANFVGTLETVRNVEVSLSERCKHRLVLKHIHQGLPISSISLQWYHVFQKEVVGCHTI